MIHALPIYPTETRFETQFEVFCATEEPPLRRTLGDMIPGAQNSETGWQWEKYDLGTTTARLSDLADVALPLCRRRFILKGIKDRLNNGDRVIIMVTETNCMHAATELARNGMGFKVILFKILPYRLPMLTNLL